MVECVIVIIALLIGGWLRFDGCQSTGYWQLHNSKFRR